MTSIICWQHKIHGSDTQDNLIIVNHCSQYRIGRRAGWSIWKKRENPWGSAPLWHTEPVSVTHKRADTEKIDTTAMYMTTLCITKWKNTKLRPGSRNSMKMWGNQSTSKCESYKNWTHLMQWCMRYLVMREKRGSSFSYSLMISVILK